MPLEEGDHLRIVVHDEDTSSHGIVLYSSRDSR
jgi:hypothetical protein